MGYRDQRNALEGKVEVLQEKLEETRRALEEQRGRPDIEARTNEIEREIAAARSRIDALGAELAALRPARARPARRPGRLVAAVLIAGVVVSAAGGAAFVLLRRAPTQVVVDPITTATAHAVPAPPSRRVPSGIFTNEGVCFLSAGEDGVPDLAALARFRGDSEFRLAVFDGRTGRRRWSSEHLFKTGGGVPGNVHCRKQEAAVFVWGADRSLHFHDAKTGAERWSAQSDDTPRRAGFGPSCVSVELIDRTFADFDLASGARRACVPSSPRSSYLEDGSARDAAPAVIQVGDSTVTLTTKALGTPMLIVRSVGKRAWERKLPLAALGSSQRLRMQAREDVIVVIGSDPVEESALSLVGLDPVSGEVRYTKLTVRANNAWVPLFRIEGQYLYALVSGLRAYDPATGEEVWEASE